MKPISARRLKDLPLRALKSYAHSQSKNAKRLRDEASRLGNKAATAERAEKRARAEIALRDRAAFMDSCATLAIATSKDWDRRLDIATEQAAAP